jgi:hypothetical protein
MKIVFYVCGAMLLTVLAVGAWQWAEHSLKTAYDRPLPKQLLAGKDPHDGQVIGGGITFTINLSNLSKSVATNMWPREATSEHTQSGFGEERSEARSILVGEYSEFALKKQRLDAVNLRLAVCVLPVSVLIAVLTLFYSPDKSNQAKARRSFSTLEVFMVLGLAVAIVGCFLPWGTCAIGKYILSGEIYRLGATIFPVLGSALMWGEAVLVCAVTGMIVYLLPAISQTAIGRKIIVAAWFIGTLVSLVFLALQANYIDTNSPDVMQGFIDALKVSKWSYAPPICLITGIMIKYRLLESPKKRIASVVLISAVGLAFLVLMRFDHTRYDWSSEITTGLPFGFEMGHLAALAGFLTTTLSGLVLLICFLWCGRRMPSTRILHTVNPISL